MRCAAARVAAAAAMAMSLTAPQRQLVSEADRELVVQLLSDRDALMTAVTGSHDVHVGKLLGQEDKMRQVRDAALAGCLRMGVTLAAVAGRAVQAVGGAGGDSGRGGRAQPAAHAGDPGADVPEPETDCRAGGGAGG